MSVESSRLGVVNNVTIATTSTAAVSSAFGSQTYQIRVCASSVCFMKVGDPSATPTAAISDAMVVPNWENYITVTPGQKISIFSPSIQNVSIVEIAQ